MDDRSVFCCTKIPRSDLVDQYLPDEAICNILSRLPMKKAVQAGLLSKKWKDHWTFNPNLDLDLYYYQKPTDDVVRIINHCIASYNGTHLRTFRLTAFPREDITKEVKKWVEFAVAKQASVLDIANVAMVRLCENPGSYFDAPDSLFSCDSIESLSLNRCVFIPPLDFKGFSSLKNLSLRNTRIREETVGKVLSKCPVLESLSLYEPDDAISALEICAPSPRLSNIHVHGKHVKVIEISAPGLQFLDITGNPETLLVSAPRLVKAQLTTWLSVRGSGDLTAQVIRDLASAIAQFSDVLALTVNMHFLMLLYADCYMNGRDPGIKFEFLKFFHVMGDLDKTYGVSALLNFLSSCPSIKSVIIGPQTQHGRGNWVCEYMRMEQVRATIVTDEEKLEGEGGVGSSSAAAAAEDFSDYDDLVHLKSITMRGFSGTATGMKLVKFLLQKAVALDILDLEWEPFCYSPAVIGELTALAAKSSHAKIREHRCVENKAKQ